MNNKDILNRAKDLILNPEISTRQLLTLSSAVNQYVDFTETVRLVGTDDKLIDIEEQMLENINCHCDEIESGFVKRLSFK